MPRLATLALLALATAAQAQSNPLPAVRYTVRVDSADLSGVAVELRLRDVPDTFRLAMAAHPEYDDQYWRHVDGPRVEGRGGVAGAVSRLDSALWRVVAPGGEAVVRYRVRFPAEGAPRAAWRPFLSPTGGFLGAPHVYMYVVGAERAPAHVTLALPRGWDVATGLVATADPRTFWAGDVDALVDSPVLAGRLHRWRFAVDGVPHAVVYWPRPDAAPFDTAAFVGGIERMAREAFALFGRAPYRDYTFLVQDGAYGGLEHVNSVDLGAPSADLARDPHAYLPETAHEFVHTWNLVQLRPAERGGVHWRQARPTPALWWSEGATMFYADLLPRRAGVRAGDSTRVAHLESLVTRYLANAGNTHVAPERASLAEYGSPPGSTGDYDPSVHVQGELIAVALDLMVRDATAGRRSLDDVMRRLLARHAGPRGFTGRDVERAVTDVCGCAARPFFDAHVRGARALDVDRWLRLAGLRARVTWAPATDGEGRPAPDLRLRAWVWPGDSVARLLLLDPASAWGRAGLRTGDVVRTIGGAPVRDWATFRAAVSRLRVGDSVRVEVERAAGPFRTTVVVAGHDRPVVRIEEDPAATGRQRALRARWLAGAP